MRVLGRRELTRGLLLGCALALAVVDARAALLPFTGTFSLRVTAPESGLDATFAVPAAGVAAVETSGGFHLVSLALDGAIFAAASSTVPLSAPTAFPIQGLHLSVSNEPGAFDHPGGGIMPLDGWLRFCLFGTCASPLANLVVPLSVVGQGGTHSIMGSVALTMIGAPWTFGTVSVSGLTAMGDAFGPAGDASSTAQASGHLQLVTPIRISTNIGVAPRLPATATLALHFVPETGTVMLVATGVVALAAGRRAARRTGS